MKDSRKKMRITKALAVLITALMLISVIPFIAFANDDVECAHQCDSVCGGFIVDCAHEHSEGCYTQTPESCTFSHEHDEECGGLENAGDCAFIHEHSEECGGLSLSCPHVCGEDCAQAAPESCTHACGAESGCLALCRHEYPTDECIFCGQGIEPCEHGGHPDFCEGCNEVGTGAFGDDPAPASSGFKASFEGIDLSGDADSYTSEYRASWEVSRVLYVLEKFEGDGEKKIAVNIGPGFALDQAPGMVATDDAKNNWTFDLNALQGTQYEGIITGAQWIQADTVRGRQIRSGRLVYTLSTTTLSAEIELKITADRYYLGYGEDQSFSNPVVVETHESGALKNKAALESFTIKNHGFFYMFYYNPVFVAQNIAAVPGADYELPLTVDYRYDNIPALDWLHGEIKLTLGMPKGAGLNGARVAGNINSTNTSISEVDIASNPDYDIITVTIDESAEIRGAYIWLTCTLPGDAPANQVFRMAVLNVNITRWDNSVVNWKRGDANGIVFVGALPGCKVLDPSLTNLSLSDSSCVIYSQEASAPADMAALGLFTVSNETINDISGQRIRLDFSNPNIGVKAVRLFAGIGGASNIKVISNKNSEGYLIANAPVTNHDYYALLNMASTMADDEYITSLEYDTGLIPSGEKTVQTAINYGFYAPEQNAMFYYGKLLVASDYSATICLLKNEDGSWVSDGEPAVNRGVIRDANPVSFSMSSSIRSIELTGGGEFQQTALAIFSRQYRYDNVIGSHQGWVFYVREVPGLQVDPSSIYVSWNGKIYKSYDVLEDIDGNKLYRIVVSDQIFGTGTKDVKDYPSATIYAKIRALPTAKTQDILLREVLFSHALGGENLGYVGGVNYTLQKTLTFSDGTTTNIACPPQGKIGVTANADFAVGTSADKNDGNWLTYLGTEDSYIPLNAQLDARYKVEMANNTGKVVDGGLIALIPIPKRGENTGHEQFQTSNFEWSLRLDGPISLGDGYTVQYSTSYLTSEEGDWKNAADISDWKAVRMVKVVYSASIPVDYSTSFHFPLKIDHTADEIASFNLQGAVNIYSSRVLPMSGSGNMAWRASAPVALSLNTGIIKGSVYMDDNRDGASTGDDVYGAGITVRAYTAGRANEETALQDSATTKADGSYMLAGLSSEPVDLVFSNPGSTANPMRYIASPQPESNANLVLPNVTPGTNEAVVKDALLQKPWTVSFSLPAGVTAVGKQLVYPGAKASRPETTPVLTGHNFDNWYKESSFTTPWNFDTLITGDTIIHGNLILKPVTVTFNTNGSLDEPADPFTPASGSNETEYGKTVSNPGNPTRPGYVFNGWTSSSVSSWTFGGGGTAATPENGLSDENTANPKLSLSAEWIKITSPSVSQKATGLYINTNTDTQLGTSWNMSYADFNALTAASHDKLIEYAVDTVTAQPQFEGNTLKYSSDFNPADFIVPETTRDDANGVKVKITVTENDGIADISSKSFYLQVYLVDDSKPVIATAKNELLLRKGTSDQSADIISQLGISHSDDHANAIVLKVNEQLSWSDGWDGGKSVGSYKLTIKTKDIAGNEGTATVNVKIFEEILILRDIQIFRNDVTRFDGDVSTYLSLTVSKASYNEGGGEVDISASDLSIADIDNVQAVPGTYGITVKTALGKTETCNITVLEDVYTVTFKYNNGAKDSKTQVTSGNAVKQPTGVERPDYILTGWTNVTDGGAWSFGSPVTHDIVLSADWVYNPPVIPEATATPGTPTVTPGTPTVRPSAAPSPSPTATPGKEPTPVPAATDDGGGTPTSVPTVAPSQNPDDAAGGNTEGDGTGGESSKNTETLEGSRAPLANLITQRGVWAFMNLILSLLSVLLLVLQLRKTFSGKYSKKGPARKIFTALSLLFGISIPVLFLLGSDFSAKLAAIDWLTIPLTIILIAQFITMVFSAKARRLEAGDDFTGAPSTKA